MTEENKKNDLGYLSRMWHERLKGIRVAMTRKHTESHAGQSGPQPTRAAESMPSNEIFTSPVHQELSAQELFSGNEGFYKALEDNNTPVQPQSPNLERPFTAPAGVSRFSITQKILAAAIFLIACVLLYELFMPVSGEPSDSAGQTVYYSRPAAETPPSAAVQQVSKSQPAPIIEPTQPISLQDGQNLYLKGNYAAAINAYDRLYKSLPITPEQDAMRDLFQLQKALCLVKLADYDGAANLIRGVLNSGSPAVRAVASYNYGLLEIQKKQYLNARAKAYQAIAMIDAVDFDENWSASMKQDCYFLAAEALTREVLSLCDADKDAPKDLWVDFSRAGELFANLDEAELRNLLNSGSQQLSLAALSPKIQRFEHQGRQASYDIICGGASIEELLNRFAANAGIDMYWESYANEDGIRKQLVYLNLLSATKQQFTAVAAGCAGLMAQMDDRNVLNILNPAKYSYVSEHIFIISNQAVSLWQEFLLKFPDDKRLANAHFALGLLYASKNQPTESMAEYKLVANQFIKSPLAPYALLNSSKVKNNLRDYAGGYNDLKQLVEQFPDKEVANEAYLYYADTAARANLTKDALKLYGRVHNLGLSEESKFAAALGAGECSWRLGDYASAEKWLSQCIGQTNDRKNKDLYSAYLLSGKIYAALKNPEASYNAFQYAFAGVPSQLSKEEFIEHIPASVEMYIQQGYLVQALNLLENAESLTLSLKESVEILLLKSRVLRTMGLTDKAIAMLGDRAEYIIDSQLKAEIEFQLCQCYIEKEDLEFAYRKLTEILTQAKPGPLMYEATFRLADVCLKLERSSQAVSICMQLLDLEPPEQIKQKTLELLAMAYNQKKNYDKAALALLGQWK